ncbi:hypothetical protein J0910_20025 [Nocardiopsis sp. CNT-189]|uniref:hypothetical protein n=1 Tax=Nocardiopsis oceanisediminis TaxID=2816862 RepID=UPI003B326776
MAHRSAADGASRRAEAPGAATRELLRTGPFHAALRSAIEDSGLTLESLQRRIGRRGVRVSVTSLSYWRQGRSRPERADSLRALQAIEEILGLPRRSLAALLGPPRPRGRWARRRAEPRGYEGILEPAEALAQTVEPVLGPSDAKLRTFCQQDTAVVGADRAIREVRSRAVVRAREDGADRFMAVYCGEPGALAADIRPLAVENCRPGRVRRHPETAVVAVELLFDRRLRAGETHLLEYGVAIGDSPVSLDYRRAFRYPAETYVLSVRFDEEALPVRCFRFAQQGTDGAPGPEEELVLGAGRSVHVAEHDVGPGVLGIGWEWE